MTTPPDRLQTDPAAAAEARTRLQQAVGDLYRIERQVGEGGMAAVFLAEDVKHGRRVAIKVLHETLAHTIGIRRFLQEIDVIANLQHPHLLTLIDSGEVAGLPYYVMPYIEAASLRELITRERRLPVERAVAIACEVADGLQFAHEHGVIHRDIKPSNILMSGGHAVVADFGIATALNNAAVGRLTETGISLGSPTYMSPEQAAAERDLDARTDVYSLGCVLYEMLTGTPPIDDPSMQIAVTRKLTGTFASVRTLRPEIPLALDGAIQKALATSRGDRFATIKEFSNAIRTAAATPRFSRRLVLGGVAASVVIVALLGAWIQRQRKVVWASQRIAEINRLAVTGQYASAFELADQVSAFIPKDTTLKRLQRGFTDYLRIVTEPAGARVERQRLDKPNTAWEAVGTTPLDSVPMPRNGAELPYRLRLSLPGYQTAVVLPHLFAFWQVPPVRTFRLAREGTVDSAMVWIPGWSIRDTVHLGADSVRFSDYYLGRTEVTNREYKRFIDAGGYARREYWPETFVLDGKPVSFERAISEFRDRTGLPGPSTWTSGTYPDGQADFPVGGVSWHEAAAYARFARAALPSVAHWNRALRHARMSAWIYIPTSNLNGTGPRVVGQGMMNAHGTYDMAGNVREWVANPMENGHVTRGGGWADNEFHVGWSIPKPDFSRSADNGFRLMRSIDADSTLAHVTGRLPRPVLRDLAMEKPVSDAEFRSYRRLFDYDKAPLNAKRDSGGVTDQYRWERVSFEAAYGGERMWAWMFFPKEAQQPYQPIIYWPGSGAMTARAVNPGAFLRTLVFLVRSGRAVVLPAYKGAYDRDDSTFSTVISMEQPTNYYRDLKIQWVKDFRRTIDYFETRQDIAADKVAFFGISWGSAVAPLVLAVEPRVRAAVLNVSGVWLNSRSLPEADALNYLPRVRTPTLMLNGRHDIVFPYETSQQPFFRLLGTPSEHKKLFAYPSSHDVPMQDMVRETLGWLDKYLGPVTPRP